MRDKTYSLPLLPASMAALTVGGANAIEENLRYLISLFPQFTAQLRAEAIGTLGYLELNEAGTAGEGFLIEDAVRIDTLTIVVEGPNLEGLSWTGEGWLAETVSSTRLQLVYESADALDAVGVQAVLAALCFAAASDLDAALTLVAACKEVMSFDAVGPVALRVRGGATWALIEAQMWTWEAVEAAELDWLAWEALRKTND